MDAAAELGRNPVSTRFSRRMEMSRLTRDGTAEPVSRDQILRHARGQENIHFPCSADHEQDWQPYPVDPYSDDHTYTYRYIRTYLGYTGISGVNKVPCLFEWVVLSKHQVGLNLNGSINRPSEHPPASCFSHSAY